MLRAACSVPQVSNVATLTAGTGNDVAIRTADASATLTVTGCDVLPSITIDQPNLQTSLTYAWTQTLTPLSTSAITVPWGGGGAVQAQAVFTRTVTAATFLASFTLTIANPQAGPTALTNLQLACPWGGNIPLPCGMTGTGNLGNSNQMLVVPASSSITCMVNNLNIPATWGTQFNQPCTILTSNWLGTQVSQTGFVLDFGAPQRWRSINNCAIWSVTCSPPLGNSFYIPTLGGLPAGLEVCGSDANNALLPPQVFSVGFSGGWIGDGTQPAACASGVSVSKVLLHECCVYCALRQLMRCSISSVGHAVLRRQTWQHTCACAMNCSAWLPAPSKVIRISLVLDAAVLAQAATASLSDWTVCAAACLLALLLLCWAQTTCTSQLQLQSTGINQVNSGTQSSTLLLQATPTDCPKPLPIPEPPAPVVLPPPPAPLMNLMTVVPTVTASVTKTYIRGTFVWSVSSQLNPASQAVAQSSAGVLGGYTVSAEPKSVAGAEPPRYQLEGFVSVVNTNSAPTR